MLELLVALGVATALLGTGIVYRFVPWVQLLQAGAWVIVIGTLTSVGAGICYHVALYRALHPRGALDARWWLYPTRFHGALDRQERRSVLPWFYLGASSFVVVMVGCAAVLMAVSRSN